MDIAKFMIKNSNFEFEWCSSPQRTENIMKVGWARVCDTHRRCELCFGRRGKVIPNMMRFKKVLRIEL